MGKWNNLKMYFQGRLTKPLLIILCFSFVLILFRYLVIYEIINLSCDKNSFYYMFFVDVLPNIASLAFAGGILTFLSYNREVIESYNKELVDILYGNNKFLEKRNDIESIWNNVSKAMINNKFKDISNEINSAIKEYFPFKDNIYYSDYSITKTIKWVNESEGIIQVSDLSEVTLHSDNTNEFTFEQTTTIETKHNDQINNHIKLTNDTITVNGENVPCRVTIKNDQHSISMIFSCKLQGKLKYEISKRVVKQYNINYDNRIIFAAKFLTQGMLLTINKPSNLGMEFVSCSRKDFKVVQKQDSVYVFKNNCLILPKQGFTIITSKL